MTPAPWSSPLRPPCLSHDSVHIWRVDLCAPADRMDALRQTLSTDERARAERFVSPRDRASFTVSHGALRAILGGYVESDPSAVTFHGDDRGKPVLVAPPGAPDVRFNMSHSGGLALVAVALGREVGIDVEFMRGDLAGMDIAERFFSAGEVADLRTLSGDARTAGFFACWTRKEAYLKARGLGLLAPLDRFRVSLLPGAPCALLATDFDPADIARWTLVELAPGRDYAAALAVEGEGHAVACFDWA
jgi:4'-phosphopantetheinyl transferase